MHHNIGHSIDQALFSEFFHHPEQSGSNLRFGIKDRQPETYEDLFCELKKHCKSSVITDFNKRSKKFNLSVEICYKQIFNVSNTQVNSI